MHVQHVTDVLKSDMLKRHIADAYASHLEYTHENAYATCCMSYVERSLHIFTYMYIHIFQD